MQLICFSTLAVKQSQYGPSFQNFCFIYRLHIEAWYAA